MHTKLQELKHRSNMTNQQIADKSNVPLSTVNRIMAGQTDNPSFLNVCDMVKAMGGSLDVFADTPTGKASGAAGQCAAIDKISPIYREMIERQDKTIETKDKWIKRLFIFAAGLTAVFVAIVLFDILNGNIGYVRY